ncbi:MAG: ATP-dependent Clp protease proteolytic subunit [Leptospirales bacterium]|nr:ATP-dependent Clp protease proteolytic subunit [Leptospirales bacterium]
MTTALSTDHSEPEASPAARVAFDRRILFRRRTILLWSAVSDESARELCSTMLALSAQDPAAPITLAINSPGGANHAGWAIIDMMRAIPAPVHTICLGLAASFGAVLLAAGAPGSRSVMPHARVMIHQPWLPGEYRAVAADLKIQAQEIDRQRRLIDALLADACGRSAEEVHERSDRDAWFSAEEAVAFGLADRVQHRWPWFESTVN